MISTIARGPRVLENVIGDPIPFEHSEEAAFGAGVLHDALKAALPALESELEQRKHSGNAAAIQPLRTIVSQVLSATGGEQR